MRVPETGRRPRRVDRCADPGMKFEDKGFHRILDMVELWVRPPANP
jgi:hypothetical protein